MLPVPGNVEKHTRAETPMNAQQQHATAARLRADMIRRQNRINEAVREELRRWEHPRGLYRHLAILVSGQIGVCDICESFVDAIRARFAGGDRT